MAISMVPRSLPWAQQPTGRPAISPKWLEYVAGVMLPTADGAFVSDPPVTIGTDNTLAGSETGLAYGHTTSGSFIRSRFTNPRVSVANSICIGLLVSFRLKAAPATGSQAVASLGSDSGSTGNTVCFIDVQLGGNIAAIAGSSGGNPAEYSSGISASDFKQHTALLEVWVTPSGFTLSSRLSVDGIAQVTQNTAGGGASLPYEYLCALGFRRTSDFGGEANAEVFMTAAFVFPATGDASLNPAQALSLSGDPWQIFAASRIWMPQAAITGLPTLSASTYTPGSLSSVGWRPRITAT